MQVRKIISGEDIAGIDILLKEVTASEHFIQIIVRKMRKKKSAIDSDGVEGRWNGCF